MFVRRLLGEQRKRAVATIMSAIEGKTGHLSESDSKELRNLVLAAINQYHDTTLDVLKSVVDDGSAVNEVALQAIADFNRHFHRMVREQR